VNTASSTSRRRVTKKAVVAVTMAAVVAGFGVRAVTADAATVTAGEFIVDVPTEPGDNPNAFAFGSADDLMHMTVDFGTLSAEGPSTPVDVDAETLFTEFTQAKDRFESLTGWDVDDSDQRGQLFTEANNLAGQLFTEDQRDANGNGQVDDAPRSSNCCSNSPMTVSTTTIAVSGARGTPFVHSS
jgi:hypothetical protein